MSTVTQLPLPPIAKLAVLVRELCERPEYRDTATYAGYIAELACLHDEIAKCPRGTRENREAYAKATKVYHAARAFASSRPHLPTPNEALHSLGYTPV